MPGIVNVLGTFRGTWNQADRNAGVLLWCTADISLNLPYREIQWPGMLLARNHFEVSLVRYTNDWNNRRSGRKLILGIQPPIPRIDPAIYSTTPRVCEMHQLEIEVCLKWSIKRRNWIYLKISL
jgi:hypothetical protein